MPLLQEPQWVIDVDRGPEWLFLHVHAPHGDPREGMELAELIWQTMQQHFAKRVVLELQDIPRLHSRLIGQLVLLHKRIHSSGGTLRICGLNPANEEVLKIARLHNHLPNYRDREDAVMASRPNKPR
jgi:anti-anti-sigma factor